MSMPERLHLLVAMDGHLRALARVQDLIDRDLVRVLLTRKEMCLLGMDVPPAYRLN